MSNIDRRVFDTAVSKLKTHSRIALHFHPDRPNPAMKTVAQALLDEGFYKSQFETLLSNGRLSPQPGGDRDRWEERMFGGAYQTAGSISAQRPKYGALDIMLRPDNWIDASVIGAVAMDLRRDPQSFCDRGSYDESLQELKLLWHVLVRYGRAYQDVAGR